MTISSPDIRTNAVASASQTAFSFDFFVYDGDDVSVYVDGVEQSSGFSVTLDTPSSLPSSGTVNFSPNPGFAGGESVVMLLEAAYVQDTDIQNSGTLAEEKVETAMDKIVRLLHQLLEAVGRSVKLAKFSTTTDITFPEPAADQIVGWNAAGTDLTNKSATLESTSVVLSDNEVLAKSGSAAPAGLPVGANELVGRFGGAVSTLAVAASQIVGRAASGALKALSSAEVRTIAAVTGGGTFPNVNADVKATEAELNLLIGAPQWIRASQVGNGLTISSTNDPTITALNGTDVAYLDDFNDELRTYRFDGSNWTQVGNSFALGIVGNPTITALSETDIAYADQDGNSLRTMRFNGTDWAQVGNTLSITLGANTIAAFTSTDIALWRGDDDELRTYRFDGTDWAQVGNGLVVSAVTVAIAAMSDTDIVLSGATIDTLQKYRFDGTDWSAIGNATAVDTFGGDTIVALNATDVAFLNTGNVIQIYRFDGIDWAQVGDTTDLPGSHSSALAALNGTDVVYIDDVDELLRTYRFAFALGKPPAPPFG